jgi:SAM-dependent methyltransferase
MRLSNLERRASWSANTPRIAPWIRTRSPAENCHARLYACSKSAAGAVSSPGSLRPMAMASLAIDPRAPKGPMFRRTTLEELRDEGPFDAALASLALHHVDDLDVALDKLHSLLRRDAPLVRTRFRLGSRRRINGGLGLRATGSRGRRAEWRAEHEHLHGFDAMPPALEARFRQRSFAWGPHLSEYEPSEGDAGEERRLIESGEIRAVGFVYVGLA